MIYLFYGTNNYRINEEIKKITKNFDKMNISKYDLTEEDIKNVINDCETLSMFDDKKVVILDNASMFLSGNNIGMEEIEKYINNPNPNTIFILIANSEKLDERKKITKLIKKNHKILSFNENISANTLLKKLLAGYSITTSNLNLLIDRVGNNPQKLENEINKIKLYKNDKTITKEDILNLTNKEIDTDIFKLIDNIVKKNKDDALEIYNEMLKVNEEPLKIVILLASQFRLMYQSKELAKKGYSEKDIANTLKVHPYRVKLALQNGRNYKSDLLLKYLDNLANIDIGIKTGKENKDLALELFILKN